MKTPETKVGSYEAKTKLAELLDRAASGEVITITKRNEPIAKLISVRIREEVDWDGLFGQMDEIRTQSVLNPPGKKRLTVKELIEDGRR